MTLNPAVYPNNCGIAAHWREFAKHGYLPKFEAVQTKFPFSTDGSRAIPAFSVGMVDGQTKILCMMSLVIFIRELEFTDEQIQDPHLKNVLGSFRSIRCSYQHFENPSHHFLESLRNFTANKTNCFFQNSIYIFHFLVSGNHVTIMIC